MNDAHDAREALPIPGYDELPAGEIEHRIRSLSRPELEQVMRHERTHAHRPRVLALLRARLAELDAGASPTPGGATPSSRPGAAPGGRSPVDPATASEPFSPPPHGTHDHVGKPKGDRR